MRDEDINYLTAPLPKTEKPHTDTNRSFSVHLCKDLHTRFRLRLSHCLLFLSRMYQHIRTDLNQQPGNEGAGGTLAKDMGSAGSESDADESVA